MNNTYWGGQGEGTGDPGNLTAQWSNLQNQKAQTDALLASYSKPQTGFGGFSYTPTSTNVLPKQLGMGYGQAAGYILGGSQGAQEQLRQQYESMLRSRTGGAAVGYGNLMQRGGNSLASQGVSPQLSGLLLGGQRSDILGKMAAGIGGDEATYHSQLADLMKGTGTELAGLKTNEIGSTLNYLVGQASAKAASSGSGMQDLAGLAGLVKAFGPTK